MMINTIVLFVRVLYFLFFYHVFFQPEDPKSCEALVRHIQALGVVAVKLAQWYYNFFQFKYTEENRPLYLQYLKIFQSQNQKICLREEEIENILQQFPGIASIDPHPIKSGSIAQVHLCTSKDGQILILKRKHDHVHQEVHLLKKVLTYLSWVPSCHQMLGFVDFIREQTDLQQEALNMDRFRVRYRDDSHKLKIPQVFFVSSTILVMEYVPITHTGDQVQDVQILNTFLCWVMDQVLLTPQFHADLHFENWGYHYTHKYLVLYDFGILLDSYPVRQFMLTIYSVDKEGCYHELCSIVQRRVLRADFERAWKILEDHQYLITLEVLMAFIELLTKEKTFHFGIVRVLSMLVGLQCIDQNKDLQRLDQKEIRKFQYVTLKKQKVLSRFSHFLYETFFAKKR